MDQVCRFFVVTLEVQDTRVELILLDKLDFGTILGINWLSLQDSLVVWQGSFSHTQFGLSLIFNPRG